VNQLVQIFGAVAILAAFAGAQARLVGLRSWPYLALNFVGAAALAVAAGRAAQWGFLLLNSVWTLVSAWSIAFRVARRPAA
jgi:hypothetical protein